MNEEYVKILLANMNTEIQTKAVEVISLKSQLQLANQTIEQLQQALVNTNEENYESSQPEQAVPAAAVKNKRQKVKE
jgi:tRNA A-37 threonylcarbamoyl transferase component Bud32